MPEIYEYSLDRIIWHHLPYNQMPTLEQIAQIGASHKDIKGREIYIRGRTHPFPSRISVYRLEKTWTAKNIDHEQTTFEANLYSFDLHVYGPVTTKFLRLETPEEQVEKIQTDLRSKAQAVGATKLVVVQDGNARFIREYQFSCLRLYELEYAEAVNHIQRFYSINDVSAVNEVYLRVSRSGWKLHYFPNAPKTDGKVLLLQSY